MGVIGKYNCRVTFRDNISTSDGKGGEVQNFTNSAMQSGLVTVWAKVFPVRANVLYNELGKALETRYEVEIRGNSTWYPTKGMIISIDDGYRVFECVIDSVLNTDMIRRFWRLNVIEVA